MNAIVLNTMTGAVSEYSNFGFDTITSTHAGSQSGLMQLGGDTDNTVPIVASIATGMTLWGASLLKFLGPVYFSVKSSGSSVLIVEGTSGVYRYPLELQPDGTSRGVPGRGIRENYLSFGFENTDGADFDLDRIEVTIYESTTRRV